MTEIYNLETETSYTEEPSTGQWDYSTGIAAYYVDEYFCAKEPEPQETAVLVFSSFRSSNKPMVLDIDGKLKNLRGLPAIKYFFMKDHMMTICCSNLAKTRIRIMVAL